MARFVVGTHPQVLRDALERPGVRPIVHQEMSIVRGILGAAIPVVILAAAVGLFVLAVVVIKRRVHGAGRRSPLTTDLMRPPGYSLQSRCTDQFLEATACMSMMLLAPLVVFSVHVSQAHYGEVRETAIAVSTMIGLVVLTEAYCIRRLIRALRQHRLALLGMQGEMFTGEELNLLMLDGCRVFHDVEFPYGNIDHVVVSPSGVYAVETKMLGKPRNAQDDVRVVVDHEARRMQLPDRNVPIPESQLQAAVRWLGGHLSSATGFEVRVEPILALPGWFVERRGQRKPGDVFVINPRNPKKFFVHDNRQVLSPQRMQQVVHQMEQLCRNVAPSFGRESKRSMPGSR